MELRRFWNKVNKTETCWLWIGRTDREGYGRFDWPRDIRKGKSVLAHRIAYELVNGPIPEGATLDHLCRVRHCVNPAHLEAVPIQVNVERGTNHNREKTVCIHGHPLDGLNPTARQPVKRRCLACHRNWQRAYNKRRAA